ncbi:MAG: hypothetical protein ACLU8D_13535 [Enterocloster sp.]
MQATKEKESMSMWKIILIVNLAVYILSLCPSGAYQRDGRWQFQAPMRWWKRI